MNQTIEQQVLAAYNRYDFSSFTGRDVESALGKDNLDETDYAALLSPAAEGYLEPMAYRARALTRMHFGNAVQLMTPLYIANYCVNHCVYCGYNCKNNIKRAKLSFEEIEAEYRTIAQTGLKEILILTGESRAQSDLAYIGRACELAQNYFSTIGIEIYPVDAEEYAYLHSKGADFVSVYQETYNTQRYDEVHLSGPKKDFSYRFNAQERALLGGMRGVGFGALLGLSDFRRDTFAAGLHAKLIQARYPHAEISFSVPRLRPFKNQGESSPLDVHETQLLQVMLAYRLLLPFAGMTISSRERAGFRDNVAGMAATKLSASVKTSVGGHDQEEKGDAQFEIADGRSLRQVEAELTRRGMQPVYTDYIRV